MSAPLSTPFWRQTWQGIWNLELLDAEPLSLLIGRYGTASQNASSSLLARLESVSKIQDTRHRPVRQTAEILPGFQNNRQCSRKTIKSRKDEEIERHPGVETPGPLRFDGGAV